MCGNFSFTFNAGKSHRGIIRNRGVGTSLLPGLEIEEEKLPYEVRSFGSENIGNETSLGITDVLNQSVPGVFTNEVQGSPYQGDVTFRGFRASSILGATQGLSVYIDGIRINEPFGDVVNWDMVPEFALDNVSLIPGSNPMYGLNTLGGALSLTTKSGLSDPGKVARISFGSFNRKKIDLSIGGEFADGDGGNYFLSASHFDESGWRDYSDGKVSNIFGKATKNTDFGSFGVMAYFGDSDLLETGFFLAQTTVLKMMSEKFKKAVYMKPEEKQFTLTQTKRKMKWVF